MEGTTPARPVSPSGGGRLYVWGVLIFVTTMVLGLYYVKWLPYFHKLLVAESTHGIGPSILTGAAAAPPAVGWHAAWAYAVAYGKAIWEALFVGLLVGSGVQALLPRAWLARLLGRAGFASTAVAGVIAVPSMM